MIVGALLLGMIGLLMSLCGGGFTLMSLGQPQSVSFVAISVPAFLLGLGFIWLCVRILRRVPTEPDK
jgi:hypothetical protein